MMNEKYVTGPIFVGRNWSTAPDEEVFAREVVTCTDEDMANYKRERAKRLEQKRVEKERAEREQFERINAIKLPSPF